MRILSQSYGEIEAVSDELKRLGPSLEQIGEKKNAGMLRGFNGITNRGFLNMGLVAPQIEYFYSAPTLSRLARWFIFMSDKHFKTEFPGELFKTMGYVGLTEQSGFVNYLHTDAEQGRLLLIAGTTDGPDVSTMYYTGDAYNEEIEREELSMPEAIERLGADSFVQPGLGRLTLSGPADPHGEPPVEAGLPRLYLLSATHH